MLPVRPLRSTVVTRFLATMSLSDSRPGPPPRLWISSGRWVRLHSPPCRVSQVPRLICPCALHPLTPGSPATASTHFFIAGVRLRPIWRIGHFHLCNEAETVLLALRLTGSSLGASSKPVARLHARLTTCRVGNSHGEFLSSHKSSQAWPGAPDEHGFSLTR